MAHSNNYVLKITLRGIDNPVISRTLSVPRTTTFQTFHKTIQIAFGWDSTHPYKFDLLKLEPHVSRPSGRPRESRILLLSLLENPDPLKDLIPSMKSAETPLKVLLDVAASIQLEYIYDTFGDAWVHTIEKLEWEAGDGVIECDDGIGRGVVEGCGGITGWKTLKSIYWKLWQARDQEQARMKLTRDELAKLAWFKGVGGEISGLNPSEWPMPAINQRLLKIEWNRIDVHERSAEERYAKMQKTSEKHQCAICKNAKNRGKPSVLAVAGQQYSKPFTVPLNLQHQR